MKVKVQHSSGEADPHVYHGILICVDLSGADCAASLIIAALDQ